MIELNMNSYHWRRIWIHIIDEGYEFIWLRGAMNDMNSYVSVEVWIHNIWIHTKDVMVRGKNKKTYTVLSWCSRIASWSHALGDSHNKVRLCVFVHLIWRALRSGRVGGGPCSGGDGQCIHINKRGARNQWGEIQVTVRHSRVRRWLWGGGLLSHDGRMNSMVAMNVWGTMDRRYEVIWWTWMADGLWWCGDDVTTSTHAQVEVPRKHGVLELVLLNSD